MRHICLESHYDMAFYEDEIEMIQENYRKKRLRESLIGPFISTIVHMVILVSLFLFGLDKPIYENKEIVVNIISQPEVTVEVISVEDPQEDADALTDNCLPDLSPELKENLDSVDTAFLDMVSDKDPTTNDLVVNDNSVSDIILSNSVFTDNISGGLEETGSQEAGNVYKGVLHSQRSKLNRISETVRNGGSKAGQDALTKALWWLASVQNPDGSWGRQHVRAATGLAVLTFLAHGDTHHSRHFGSHLKKAFKWLAYDEVDRIHDRGYGHAIKTYALCEAFSMTGLNDLKAPMHECVEELIKGQQENGGFDYKLNPDSARQDTSVTGWCMQALKAAYVSGLVNKELPRAIENGLGWLIEKSKGKSSFPYCVENGRVKEGNKHSMRAIGALCLQLFAKHGLDSLEDELRAITTEDVQKIDWIDPPSKSLYAWYYATQSAFQAGGASFRRWNAKMETMLVANQEPKGYWIYPGKGHAAEKMDDLTAKIYSTTLCSLMLTVYYRYLPTYRGLGRGSKAVPEKEEMVNVVE